MSGVRVQRGLTLVEVLIASVIFFTLLVVAVESYLTSAQSSRRAEQIVAALAPMPLVMDRIRADLGQQPVGNHVGEGVMRGVKYRYRADITQRGSPAAELATDIAVGGAQTDRFVLYDVQLSLEAGGRTLQFKYQEFAW